MSSTTLQEVEVKMGGVCRGFITWFVSCFGSEHFAKPEENDQDSVWVSNPGNHVS